MKKSNVILSVLLVLLVVVGWVVQLGSIAKTNIQYNACLKDAKQYNEAGLYQKAIQSYEKAFEIEDKQSVRDQWLDSYGKAYADGAVTYEEYVDALEIMCDLYEFEASYWETLIALQMDNGKMDKAHASFVDFKKKGISSKVIDGYENTILYQYRVKRKPYVEVIRNTNGFYTVHDSRGWGSIGPDGVVAQECVFEYVSPYNLNQDALFISEKGQRIADKDGIIQVKLNLEYTKTGAWSEGLLPVCDPEGRWYYLNCDSHVKAHGSYEQASNYVSGIAAVNNGSEWTLIDVSGSSVCEKKFSDIKLHSNGDYQFDGIMIAAENGEYGIYDAKGKLLGDVNAKDMDIYMGGSIAYCDKTTGKWGMVNKDGKVVCEPTYAGAKSYSNNLAAINNGELWGFVNQDEEVVIDYQFKYADYFTKEGLCAVSEVENEYIFIQLKYVDD